ncbi:MAG: hypothetical protein DRQ37_08680 [Gammaproteobacteria bacterium]|nr:MAG: hypothetical protein DRQ37_08680 [Gammaproteobacteria bacterium]
MGMSFTLAPESVVLVTACSFVNASSAAPAVGAADVDALGCAADVFEAVVFLVAAFLRGGAFFFAAAVLFLAVFGVDLPFPLVFVEPLASADSTTDLSSLAMSLLPLGKRRKISDHGADGCNRFNVSTKAQRRFNADFHQRPRA